MQVYKYVLYGCVLFDLSICMVLSRYFLALPSLLYHVELCSPTLGTRACAHSSELNKVSSMLFLCTPLPGTFSVVGPLIWNGLPLGLHSFLVPLFKPSSIIE